MADSNSWSSLPQRWLHVQLPGYRELPEHHTYEGSRLEELPPIPIGLDDDCEWLMRHGTAYPRGGLNRYERDVQPPNVEKLALAAHVELPRSFRLFMISAELRLVRFGVILSIFFRILSHVLIGPCRSFPVAIRAFWNRQTFTAIR